MTINVHKNKARCIRCGLQLKFGWWISKSRQLREFTMMHETLVALRQMKLTDGTKVDACGRVRLPAPKKAQK
jgi:hypothetical protein